MENRHALVVDTRLIRADPGHRHCRTRGCVGDGGGPSGQSSDHARCRQGLRCRRVCRRSARAQCDTARLENTTSRRSAIDGRTTRHPGCASASRRCSAGPRRQPASATPIAAALLASAGCLRSRPLLTTWSGCPSCWRSRRTRARNLPGHGKNRQNSRKTPACRARF
jgi:hypothetical protein